MSFYSYLVFFLIFYSYGLSFGYRIRVLKTAVVPFLPELKQHHVVVVEHYNRILYAIDFTPINQSSVETLTSLALARDVPAEVRVKFLTNVDFYDDLGIIHQWLHKPCVLSGSAIFPCLDHWDSSFINMYLHNCQHFSAFFLGSSN
jgi:hypothetical protein